jgi:hypothetical protein
MQYKHPTATFSPYSSSCDEACNPCLDLTPLMQDSYQTPIRCQKKDGSVWTMREWLELDGRVFTH